MTIPCGFDPPCPHHAVDVVVFHNENMPPTPACPDHLAEAMFIEANGNTLGPPFAALPDDERRAWLISAYRRAMVGDSAVREAAARLAEIDGAAT